MKRPPPGAPGRLNVRRHDSGTTGFGALCKFYFDYYRRDIADVPAFFALWGKVRDEGSTRVQGLVVWSVEVRVAEKRGMLSEEVDVG
jgi:hypothetical protein